MKFIGILSLVLLSLISKASFDDWFYPRTLRIDYYHTGDAQHELFSLDEIKSEPFWGGSLDQLIDSLNMGEYYFKVYDKESNTLIYSYGFCSLFAEWQLTEEAKHLRKSFSETLVMPYPKKDIRVEILSRNSMGAYLKVHEFKVEPDNYFITSEQRHIYPQYDALVNGNPSKKVDIVILPEGYRADEMEKFKKDCDKFTLELFTFEPFKQNKDKFNIRGILAPSAESGNDIPGDRIWKKTILNTTFYTFDSERYLMTYDNKSVRDLASNVPYDQIYILVNTSKYGGGAIYNFYSTSVNSNSSSAKIFVHELGHGFAGLADEYDDGSTSFNDMYPLNIEPWEPNLTTLVDFKSKWEKLLPENTIIPTPLNKEDPLKLGVYEGGGYVAKGVYRPATDCMMRSFKGNSFCKVCETAIQKMIDYYTD
jgi:hypothetical protein